MTSNKNGLVKQQFRGAKNLHDLGRGARNLHDLDGGAKYLHDLMVGVLNCIKPQYLRHLTRIGLIQ